MRRGAAALVLSTLIAPLCAQRAAIKWESGGGPPMSQPGQAQTEWQRFGSAAAKVSVVAAPWGDVYASAGSMGLFKARAAREPWERLLLGDNAHVSMYGPSGGATASWIAVTAKGDLLADTQLGVLRSRDRGQTWQRVGLTRQVKSLVSTKSGALLAGTADGIFRSIDDGESWIERSIGLTSFHVQTLAVAADGTVYAGTWEGDVFRSPDEGNRWRPMTESHASQSVRALVLLSNGDVLGGGYPCVVRWDAAEQQWRGIYMTPDRRPIMVRALLQDSPRVSVRRHRPRRRVPVVRRRHILGAGKRRSVGDRGPLTRDGRRRQRDCRHDGRCVPRDDQRRRAVVCSGSARPRAVSHTPRFSVSRSRLGWTPPASASARRHGSSFIASADSLFDRQYYVFYLNPGRTWSAGARVTLGDRR